jgi:hypothetical protein
MTDNGRRFGTFVGAVAALAAAAALWGPAPVSACIGGMPFDWAIEHSRSWIATATIVEVDHVAVGFHRVVLDDVEPVKGSPPSLLQATIVMGAVCDQSPDAGERILVLDGQTIEPPYDTPVAYVIRGSDAIPAADVARALGSLPSTDTAPAGTAIPSRPWDAAWLLAIGLGAVWLAMRRFARSAADPDGSTRSRPQR